MRQLISILLLFFCLHSPAQNADRFQIQQYSTENGLPSNGIKGLKWDEENGFLWIATEAGVARFNGIDFRIFSKGEQSSQAIERVVNFTPNDLGETFAIDLADNVYKIEQNKLKFFSAFGKDLPEKLKTKLQLQDIDRNIIKKIVLLAKSSLLGTVAKVIRTDSRSCLLADTRNNLWHFTSLTDTVSYSLISESSCKQVFKTGEEFFMLSTNNHFYRIRNNLIETHPLSIKNEAGDVLTTPETNLLVWETGMTDPIWFAGENAWLLEFENNSFVAKNIYPAIPPNTYIRYAQYYKKGNILFVGTDSKGILVITKKRVIPMRAPETDINERNAYYSQIKLNNNAIITNEGQVIGTGNMGKNLPVKGKFSFRTSITDDSVLWYQQLYKRPNVVHSYNFKTGNTTIFEKIGPYTAVSVALLNNKTYITTPEGTGILENDSLRYLHTYPVQLDPLNEPFDMTRDDDGSLLFATCNSLLKFNPRNNLLDTLFTSNGHCIRTLNKSGSYIFIGTYGGGFFIYKNGIVKSIPLDKNNFLLYTHCFAFDNYGFCWMSTNRGLFKAKLTDLINAFEKNTVQIYYHYFGKKDGMEMTEMNGGCSPCAVNLNDEIISFPTMDGLLWVNTKTAVPVLLEGNIFIDEFTVDEKTFFPDSDTPLKLSSDTKDIEISIGYSAWCNKENIYLDYRLNDKGKWIPFDTKTEAVIKLSNLSQGSYKLQIRKLNGFGDNNYSYETLRFTIAVPWYLEWWFFALVAAGVLGIFMLFYKVRTRQLKKNQLRLEMQVAEKTDELQQKNEVLEKNNTINTRLISIISHDIITPLKFLNVAGKNLQEKKDQMPEELKDETIKEITTTSKELQLLSTNILNWIKYQNENRRLAKEKFMIYEMVNQVFSVLNSMANQKNIQLKNSIDTGMEVMQYFEPLKILVYNLITNAIDFSEKGNIIVDAVETTDHVTISVQDQGVGMTKEQIKNIMADQFIVSSANVDNKKGNGLGYLIIKDLLKMMNAQININSEKNKGTTVYLMLPR